MLNRLFPSSRYLISPFPFRYASLRRPRPSRASRAHVLSRRGNTLSDVALYPEDLNPVVRQVPSPLHRQLIQQEHVRS